MYAVSASVVLNNCTFSASIANQGGGLPDSL
jgi:hypothetical protein